jgi:phage terminase large subunit
MKGGRNFLICRQVGRTLRGSVVQEIAKIIISWNLSALFSMNKTDGTVTCSNGYQIVFAGLDDVEKLKSLTPAKGVFTDVRIEEATECERSSVKQLLKRQRGGDEAVPKRLVLSFNPVLISHWIYEEYFKSIGWADDQKEYNSRELSILRTTYRDNQFITRDDVLELQQEKDKYYFDVYSEGRWGILGNVIFTDWKVADLSDPGDEYYLPEAQRTNRRHGLDFGFSSDPAAVPITHYDRAKKRIYVYDEIYERGLTNDVLAGVIKSKAGSDYLKGDSAEPKSIAELQRDGVNIYGAKKGKDSVMFGIQWLQQHTIIVDKNCVNMRNELSQYKWREDSAGNAIRQPVDRNNHLIDGLRYAYEDDMLEARVEYLPGLYR